MVNINSMVSNAYISHFTNIFSAEMDSSIASAISIVSLASVC